MHGICMDLLIPRIGRLTLDFRPERIYLCYLYFKNHNPVIMNRSNRVINGFYYVLNSFFSQSFVETFRK